MPPNDALRERFGANLRDSRKRLNISQWELAFRAETGITSVGPIELGQKIPRIDTFIRLAGALKVSPNELAAGILWTPAEIEITPGSFDVPEDPEFAAEVAALRKAAPGRGKRAKR